MKYLDVDPDKCTACRLCEYTCSLSRCGEIKPAESRITVNVFSERFFFYPNVCRQCGNAPCIEACPKEALTVNRATGAVEVVEENCIGCRMCVRACPFGTMKFRKEEKMAFKCDLCGGDPECVKTCYFGAISYVDPATLTERLNREYAEKKMLRHLEEVK